MIDDNTEMARISDPPFVSGASGSNTSNRSALERVLLSYIDHRESLLASLYILRIVGGLAWRREIARRRISGWGRAFFGAWFSRKLGRILPDSGFGFPGPGPRAKILSQEGPSV